MVGFWNLLWLLQSQITAWAWEGLQHPAWLTAKLRRLEVREGELESKWRERTEGRNMADLPNIFCVISEKTKFILLTPRLICIQPLDSLIICPSYRGDL